MDNIPTSQYTAAESQAYRDLATAVIQSDEPTEYDIGTENKCTNGPGKLLGELEDQYADTMDEFKGMVGTEDIKVKLLNFAKKIKALKQSVFPSEEYKVKQKTLMQLHTSFMDHKNTAMGKTVPIEKSFYIPSTVFNHITTSENKKAFLSEIPFLTAMLIKDKLGNPCEYIYQKYFKKIKTEYYDKLNVNKDMWEDGDFYDKHMKNGFLRGDKIAAEYLTDNPYFTKQYVPDIRCYRLDLNKEIIGGYNFIVDLYCSKKGLLESTTITSKHNDNRTSITELPALSLQQTQSVINDSFSLIKGVESLQKHIDSVISGYDKMYNDVSILVHTEEEFDNWSQRLENLLILTNETHYLFYDVNNLEMLLKSRKKMLDIALQLLHSLDKLVELSIKNLK